MFRETFAITAILLAFWAVGVSALAFEPFGGVPGNEAATNDRPTLRLTGATVLSAHQDVTGKYTVFVRTSGRINDI